MRVISGVYRGRQLTTLKSVKLRPTSDQLRETLFDVLGSGIEGAVFLDAYAGSGAVGIEALSRGAAEVVFVEQHRAAVAVIRKNLEALAVGSDFRLMTTEVTKAVKKLTEEGARFDYVFLDPPYAEVREYHHALRKLGRSGLLGAQSLVIAEHSRHTRLEEQYGTLVRVRLLRHGDAQLGFYRRG